jgi:acetyltransferase-like isoleucine patch superfamily enzyme
VSVGAHVTIHCHDESGHLRIGDDTVIKKLAILMTYPGGHISIGRNCSINPFCVLYGHGGLVLGDNVRIATHCVIVPAEHKYQDRELPITQQGVSKNGVRIGSDVWLGAGTIVLDGCEIGDGCVIGAGSVVTRSLPPYSIAIGVPAKVIRQRGEAQGLN